MPNIVDPTIPNYPPQGIQAQLDLLYLYNPDVVQKLIDQLNAGLADMEAFKKELEKALQDLQGVLRYKGSVETEADLPTEGNVIGDVWNITSTDENVAWNGTSWDKFGSAIDPSAFVTSVNTKKGDVVLTGTDINATLTGTGDPVTTTVTEHLQTLKNDETQLGNQVSEIQALIPSDASDTNLLATKADIGDGGLSAVSHDATLAGSGTDADPLKVADNTYLPLSGGILTGGVDWEYKTSGWTQLVSFGATDSNVHGLLYYPPARVLQLFIPGWSTGISFKDGAITSSQTSKPLNFGSDVTPAGKGRFAIINNGVDLAVPTTGGTLARLEDIPAPELPTQEGNAGKFLTTNGTEVSWAEVQAGGLPDQAGHTGFLQTDGTNASWSDSKPVINRGTNGSNFVIGNSNTRDAAQSDMIVFGNNSSASYAGTITIGRWATNNGYDNSIVIGADASISGVGGYSANYAPIAIGSYAKIGAVQAIQIGTGTNNSQRTVQFYDYRILNADGTIPTARLAADGTTGQVLSKTDTGMQWVDMSGGVSEIFHDDSLSGKGTETEPLSVARPAAIIREW